MNSQIQSLIQGLQDGKIVLLYSLNPGVLLRKYVKTRFLTKTVSRVESKVSELKILLQNKSWSGRRYIVIIQRYDYNKDLIVVLKTKSSKIGVLIVHDGEYHSLRPALENVADLTIRMGRGPENLFTHMGKNDLENPREVGDDTLLIRLVQSRSKTSEDLDTCSDTDILFTKVPSEMAMSLLPLSTMQQNYSKSKWNSRQVEQDRLTNEQFLDHVIQWYSKSVLTQHAELKFRAWCSSFGPGTFVSNGTVVTCYGQYLLI
jgi:hypothetical protein